jgi:esterase/lipase superfamily enzyme
MLSNAAACRSGGLAFRAPGVALVFGAALGVSGCVGPDMSEIGDYGAALSPFATASVPQKPRPVQIFVASTRKGESGAAARQQAPEAHFALATMTIPPGHRPGSIEAPIWGQANGKNDIMVAGERELDGDEFRAELAFHLSGRIGVNRDILVFVHGFNTSFDEARSRAAQIVADTHFGGVAVLFTWPSKSDLFGYVSDKESATASRDALQALLHDLGQTPGAGKIQIIAHSMGGWLTMEALRASAIGGDRDLGGHLDNVILASPDIDMTVFASQMARIRPAKVTVFATPNDRALSLSSFIASSRQRVGAIDASTPGDRAEIESLGAKVVDITAYADADRFISHAVYADSPQVLSEIGAQIEKPRAEDAKTVSVIDASKYVDPDAAPAPVIAAPGSAAAMAVQTAPLAPPNN